MGHLFVSDSHHRTWRHQPAGTSPREGKRSEIWPDCGQGFGTERAALGQCLHDANISEGAPFVMRLPTPSTLQPQLLVPVIALAIGLQLKCPSFRHMVSVFVGKLYTHV